MKKTILFAVASVVALTACNKENGPVAPIQDEGAEISVVSAASTAVKGYVTGATLVDTDYNQLHEATPATTERKMLLSAYATPKTGEAGNYFVAKTFVKQAADGYYHNDGDKIYWPLASSVDFLAVSSTKTLSAKWNADNAAEQVVLDITDDYLQEDVLFASVAAASKANSTDKGIVPMTFNHSQAWIEFDLKVADDTMKDIITIKDIKLENIFSAGELTINGGTKAEAKWNFANEKAADQAMDETNVTLNEKSSYMDILVPEQTQTSILITYTLAGNDKELQYRYDMNNEKATWKMGSKYIYAITFSLYEIIVNPSVTPFEIGDVTNFTPTELS